jgi:hypothetical protein
MDEYAVNSHGRRNIHPKPLFRGETVRAGFGWQIGKDKGSHLLRANRAGGTPSCADEILP